MVTVSVPLFVPSNAFSTTNRVRFCMYVYTKRARAKNVDQRSSRTFTKKEKNKIIIQDYDWSCFWKKVPSFPNLRFFYAILLHLFVSNSIPSYHLRWHTAAAYRVRNHRHKKEDEGRGRSVGSFPPPFFTCSTLMLLLLLFPHKCEGARGGGRTVRKFVLVPWKTAPPPSHSIGNARTPV